MKASKVKDLLKKFLSNYNLSFDHNSVNKLLRCVTYNFHPEG